MLGKLWNKTWYKKIIEEQEEELASLKKTTTSLEEQVQHLKAENSALRETNRRLQADLMIAAERIAAQAELLSTKAEK